ncbi:MAG: histidine phosphatase family protein, partial [Eubacteriales bacterium]
MKLYFVRHLKTKGNYEKRYIGCTDESIAFNGDEQLNYKLPEYPDKIYASPMKRCIQTAHFLYPERKVCTKERLKEMNFGEFENHTYEELKDNKNYQDFIQGIENPIGGESRTSFKERCLRVFHEITTECKPEEEIVIVCHGGTIMAIMEKLEVQHRSFYDYQIPNGGVYECEY